MTIYRSKEQWMATPEYQQLRRRVFKAQNHRCADCGEKLPLELHHLSYQFGGQHYRPDKSGTPWGMETLGDVVGLCRECHKQRHIGPDGEFYADPDELIAECWAWYK